MRIRLRLLSTRLSFIILALAIDPRATAQAIISTVAGTGTAGFFGDSGLAASASLNGPSGVSVDTAGNIFITDSRNGRVRKISPSAIITTVAGNGNTGFFGDGGPATNASLNDPEGIAIDTQGNLYIADTGNNRIRKIAVDGTITTVAGNGTAGFSGDGGSATDASLKSPTGVAVDAAGSIYIADFLNNRIRKVTSGGIITTVAGTGAAGSSGDGGLATNATLHGPEGVAVDAAGNLYIADSGNNRIRKIDSNGTIATLAGGNGFGYSGDGGPATNAQVGDPVSVAVDTSGNLFLAESDPACAIRKVSTDRVISTVAGNGVCGFSGDGGLATNTSVGTYGVAVDAGNNLLLADHGNNRIRKVSAGAAVPAVPVAGVVNGASFASGGPVAPGSIASVFGTNLASALLLANTLPLPVALSGTSVRLGGQSVPLFFISSLQVNFQVPWELGGQTEALLTVTSGAQTSSPQTVNLAASAPGIFSINSSGAGQGVVQIANTTTFAAPAGSIPGAQARPVSRGEYLTIYCTGLGTVSNPPASGAAASGSSLSPTMLTLTVTVGGQTVAPSFSGLAPGFVGLYQVNVQVPATATTGGAVPLTVTIGGATSNTVTIAVQ